MVELLADPQVQAIALSVTGLAGGIIPFVVAIICSALWWRKLVRPGFFMLTAILAMWGLQALLRSGFYTLRTLAYLVGAGAMEYSSAPGAFVVEEIMLTAIAGVLTAVIGVLFLRTAMRYQLPPLP